ncbi:hypothetical protein Pr1d_20150 [Bythopirellula goksoeyrii]|uniref:Ice-binding protein C-terminal domain-containing protein n=2 Tax=Bythopirellula goksoeyrii TaxID=1400387 RepID=A0A5B9QKY2_9BACT|nr:hypothetical protein Pr1d_20150 [Bythopirellula goksoeyrii]
MVFEGESVMKKFSVTSLGLLLALSVISTNSWALIFQFDGGGLPSDDFQIAANWNDFAAGPDAVPGAGDRAIINDNFVVQHNTAVTTTLGSLIVGADWPVTGELGTDGTLNLSAGKIIVTGGGDNFQIARARGAVVGDADGDGLIVITNAELEISGSDPIVGTRDHGVLDVGLNGKVYNTPGNDNYWRLGNYGPSVDAGLEGNGLLDVHDNGTFNAHVIFIGDRDSTGELRVSDTGSVVLTGNLVARPSGFEAGGSAKVQMNGATATLSAFNLESESLVGEVPTLYEFNADSLLGVSAIKLQDAINITNNELVVNLNSFPLANLSSILLFDGDQSLVGDRVFGTFASTTVSGGALGAQYSVVYDQAVGDILLQRIPEPSTILLFGLSLMFTAGARRRQSC